MSSANNNYCHLKEGSLIARIAAWNLNASRVAIVIGKTIHLHNSCKGDFLENRKWVRHELKHVEQFTKYGNLRFILLCLMESVRMATTKIVSK